MGNWAIPILALQILAIDLFAEVMPLTCLTFDPSSKRIMGIPPRERSSHIMNQHSTYEVLFFGALIGLLAFSNYAFYMLREGLTFTTETMPPSLLLHYARATTLSYLTIAFCQFANVLSRRNDYTSVFNRNFFSNKILLWSIVASIGLILLAIYVPFLSRFLYFAGPRLIDWVCVLGASVIFLGVFELMKAGRRIRWKKAEAISVH